MQRLSRQQHNNKKMNNNGTNSASAVKLNYEAPKIDSIQLELEYCIASGSFTTDSGWKDTQTTTREVENSYW